ncbi:MAG TPA: hypothetical protein VFD58_08330 [Blastocatellia bacterium]|nr:hypothetical protein [Blastocatellia bacterium]
MAVEQVIEGTWEEIAERADELAGHRLRVTILGDKSTVNGAVEDDVNPNALEEAISVLVNRSPEEKAAARERLLQQSRPPRPLPEGKTLADVVCGQWPGDETDEQVNDALRRLS